MAGREIMDTIGLGQKYSNEIIGKVHKLGNNLGLPEPALVDTLEEPPRCLRTPVAVEVDATDPRNLIARHLLDRPLVQDALTRRRCRRSETSARTPRDRVQWS